MQFRERRRKEPQLIVVPLVDVVLQLVIFLLVTTSFKVAEVKMDVSLPSARAPVTVSGDRNIINLDREGTVTVDGREMSPDGLEITLRRWAEGDGESRVLLRADRMALHGDVMTILDSARRNDLRRVSIAVLPGGEERRRAPESGGGTTASEKKVEGS